MIEKAKHLPDIVRVMMLSPWLRIWAQGGQLEPQAGRNDHRVFGGDMVIETEVGLFRLGAVPIEVKGAEDFALSLDQIREVGTAESERMFRPPRQVVDSFPASLEIDRFIGRRPELASLLCEPRREGARTAGILFELERRRLAFWADDVLPGALATSTAPEVISGVLDSFMSVEVRRMEAVRP